MEEGWGGGFSEVKQGEREPLAALMSGGKDSWYAAWLMSRLGYPLRCAIVMLPRRDDSWMFHFPGVDKVPGMLERRGLPVVARETPGEKEKELKDLKVALEQAQAEYGVEGVVSGALASSYQRERIERLAGELGLKCHAPLWGVEPAFYLRRLLADGFRWKIVHVAAEGLGEDWLGRVLDEGRVEELISLAREHRFHPAGEGGEYETLVVEAPDF